MTVVFRFRNNSGRFIARQPRGCAVPGIVTTANPKAAWSGPYDETVKMGKYLAKTDPVSGWTPVAVRPGSGR